MSLAEIITSLAEYDTSLIAETIGHIDSTPPQDWSMGYTIQCLRPEATPTVGVAVTLEIDSSTPGNEWDFQDFFDQYKAIEKMSVPTVLVVKAVGARPEHECVMGDGLAKALVTIGCGGIVTDGGVKDLEGMDGIPFGIYARGRTPHCCPWRFRNPSKPVEVGGITVRPGDVIHANKQGVIKIPPSALEILPERAAAMLAFEHRAHAIFRQPSSFASIDEKRLMVSALLPEYGFKSAEWTRQGMGKKS